MLSAGRFEKNYDYLEEYLLSYFESDLSSSVSDIMNSDIEEKEKYARINSLISSYEGRINVDENRTLYLINTADLKVIYPLSILGETIDLTENIEKARNGELGNTNKLKSDYSDCAVSINCGEYGSCILYARDNKAYLRSEIYYIIKYLLLSLIIALLLSLLLAYILVKRVTSPIKKITKRAEGLKKGELYENLDDIKYEEFKDLFKAINNMGMVMAKSIQRMNSDKHRVELIIEHINSGIITFESDRRVIQINTAAKNILNITDEKKVDFDKLFKELGIDIRMAEFQYFEKETVIEKEIKRGEDYLKVWFIPYKPEDKKAGVICVIEDVTKQFNVMETMKKFVADVSHELKTPITVIRSYTETVLNGYLDDKAMASHLLNIVYEESGKMNELVQNLLDISRYEMQEMPIKSEEFSIDEMLSNLKDTFLLEAEKKNLDMKYTRMTDIPLFKGSRSDLERAVKNIISNSIKYTSKGDKIRIYAGRLNNDIYIKVEDTGWGIPENKLGRLFERFYRVEEEARSRDRGGTGLGLSIAKEIIERHNGKIKIESEYTKYTKVTITLPIKEDKKVGK